MSAPFYRIDDVDIMTHNEVYKLSEQYLNAGMSRILHSLDCDIIYKKAYDCIIEDNNGIQYIDFVGGYGAFNMGHSNPYIIDAIHKIEGKANLAFIGLNPYETILAANLAATTQYKLKRSFFCNSGSEAVESALKLARAATKKTRILYCRNAYHGKTFGALSATDRPHYRIPFEPLVPDFDMVSYGSEHELREKLRTNLYSAFILEPIQGEGGVIIPPNGYMEKVREICTEYGTLLIVDEVQTGMGRTGRLYAYEHSGIVPDILCLAKSLGGGIIPIGTCITTEEIYSKAYGEVNDCNLHSSTFGGNTYASAAAIAAFEFLYKNNLILKTEEKGQYLVEGLRKIQFKCPVIKEVRGKGLLIGIEFKREQQSREASIMKNISVCVAKRLLKECHIITACSFNNIDVLRLEPPLTIEYEQIDQLLKAMEHILVDY